jgi:tRNA1Val (adenine37-N6)-methyltransferase
MFTYQYTQPDEYRFSMDSILFAEYLANVLQAHARLADLQVLDVCAGCGVIGLELSFYRPELRHIDFVEVQAVYEPFFQHNISLVNNPALQLTWYLLNYEALLDEAWSNRYDLIISNPPYFQPQQGILSPSEFKNRCRFFLDSTFKHFILAITNALKSQGQAYFLLRPLHQHGFDSFAATVGYLEGAPATATKVACIRGTDVICITKN